MDENKIIKLDIKPLKKEDKPEKSKVSSFLGHTNPIIQRLLFNSQNKKDKFQFKDLFR